MDKISGIIPASARTRTADTSGTQPARPGAPAFGRPMGRNSLGDRVTLSKQAEEMRALGILPEPQEPATYKNPAEAKKIKVIEDLNAKFFAKSDIRENPETKSEEVLDKKTQAESLFFVENALQPKVDSDPIKQPVDVIKA